MVGSEAGLPADGKIIFWREVGVRHCLKKGGCVAREVLARDRGVFFMKTFCEDFWKDFVRSAWGMGTIIGIVLNTLYVMNMYTLASIKTYFPSSL